MHEPDTPQLESSPTITSLAPQAARLVPAPECRSSGGQRSRRQPVEATSPRGRHGCPPAPTIAWCPAPTIRRAARASARLVAPPPRRFWVPRPGLAPETRRRSDVGGMWRGVPPHPGRPSPHSPALESPAAGAPSATARRRGDGVLARRGVARDQKGAEAQPQTILFLDESGCSPLPSVVRTDAPVGQTPILREWGTRDHLSAISAISPEGKLYFHSQDRALNSDDVVAFLEHLLRELPGQIVIIWDGAPIHRSRLIQQFLANGAAHRIHLERLPAHAPELNPGEGLWAQLKGVELRNLCCFNMPHLRHELRDAVRRVRRKPRLI